MNKIYIHNLPFISDISEYEKCVDLIVAEARSNPSVASLYLLGADWKPGISDIDIVVVYRDEKMPLTAPWIISKSAKKIFTHGYLSFNESNFRNLYYIYPKLTTNIRLIFGDDQMPEDPKTILSSGDYSALLVFNLVDVLVNKLLVSEILKSAYLQYPIDARRMIGELYSLSYTFKLLYEIASVETGREFVEKIKKLRTEWFDHSVEENQSSLFALIKEGSSLILDVVVELDKFLKSTDNGGHRNTAFRNKKFNIQFATDFSREEFVSTFRQKFIKFKIPFSGIKVENFALTLPASFEDIFSAYASGDGLWSGFIKKMFSARSDEKNLSVQRNFAKSLGAAKHTESINSLFGSLVKSGGFFRTPFLYGITLSDIIRPLASKLILFAISVARLFKWS